MSPSIADEQQVNEAEGDEDVKSKDKLVIPEK
jgi:hypothetical protein